MNPDELLRIAGYGAWNGGLLVDNSVFENRGMFFRGDVPVTDETIRQKIGVVTRVVAPEGLKISTEAFRDLVESRRVDPSKIRLVIGPVTTGEDKEDPGPQIRHSCEVVNGYVPDAIAFDLHAGCAGYSTAIELLLVLSATGHLREDDVSVVVGAESIVRDCVFKPHDLSGIAFGDDAVATALETRATLTPRGSYSCEKSCGVGLGTNIVSDVAQALFSFAGSGHFDAIIIDNQLGRLELKMPPTAARVQHRLVELTNPEVKRDGTFERFAEALEFYDRHVNSLAYDVVSKDGDPEAVNSIGKAYVESGRCNRVASLYLSNERTVDIVLHEGKGFSFPTPRRGIVDALTRSYGCFADVMRVVRENGRIVGDVNQRGVALFATRGAGKQISTLLNRNALTLDDVDLLVQHQANFGITLAALGQALGNGERPAPADVLRFVERKVISTISSRGNSSVVNLQRLAYDLHRGNLRKHTINGAVVNGDLDRVRTAHTVLYDSVGAGMTRSSFIEIR